MVIMAEDKISTLVMMVVEIVKMVIWSEITSGRVCRWYGNIV